MLCFLVPCPDLLSPTSFLFSRSNLIFLHALFSLSQLISPFPYFSPLSPVSISFPCMLCFLSPCSNLLSNNSVLFLLFQSYFNGMLCFLSHCSKSPFHRFSPLSFSLILSPASALFLLLQSHFPCMFCSLSLL
jgi:hypothetical protein